MRRNKVSAVLIAVQMAITLAICATVYSSWNSVSARANGRQAWMKQCLRDHQLGGQPPDLEGPAARGPGACDPFGVVDAVATNSYLSGSGSSERHQIECRPEGVPPKPRFLGG